MQGQRSTVEPFSETFEFDHGSGSSNQDMDRQIYWDSLLLNPADTQNLQGYQLSPGDTNMSYANIVSQETDGVNIWNSGGPSSSEHPTNQGGHDETKREHGWTSSQTVNRGVGLRIGDSRSEANSMLSSENVNINLNVSQMDNSQSFLQISNAIELPQNSDYNVVHAGSVRRELESGLCPHSYDVGLFQPDHVSLPGGSSASYGSSSRNVEYLSDDGDNGQGGALDSQRASCKRKNIEGGPGQSSASASSSCFYQSGNPSEEQLNTRIDSIAGAVTSDHHPIGCVVGNAESFQRNTRIRVTPSHQNDMVPPNLWSQGNAIRHSNHWSAHQPSSPLIPLSDSQESRPVVSSANPHSQPHVRIIPNLPQNLHPFQWNGTSYRSSSSSPVTLGERSAVEESDSRNIPRNIVLEHPVIVPPTNTRPLVQDPTSWSLTDGTTSMPGSTGLTSQASTSAGVHRLLGPNLGPHQNSPTQHHRRLSEILRRSLSPSGSSESRGQGINLPPRHGHSSASLEIGRRLSGAGLRGHQQPYVRSALLMDRQSDGFLSMRTLAAAREGRSRMLSEIRNALDLIGRGENLRFEDVFIFDHSVFYGGADLHDRHRDMRLDVDNMSYEELLALEERIGNVSTGLSEERIMKCLKQRKYILHRTEASAEVEPCCICQEEYIKDEDVGTLDCGHDFHTACIKEWLMLKNLCPICKTSALAS